MIQIYYGYGKGKTTAAIGAGMRAKGAGMNVLLVQFFKNNQSSELSVLPFDIFKAPDELPFNPGDDYKAWVDSAVGYIKQSDADMIILDEFVDLIPKFLSVEHAIDLLCDSDKEYILTGHSRVEMLFDAADYITNMQKEKHPYDKSVMARRGIEY